jgi:hypothetical protein
MGITQGCNIIGYDFENELKKSLKCKPKSPYLFSHSDSHGEGQTNGWKNKQTNG